MARNIEKANVHCRVHISTLFVPTLKRIYPFRDLYGPFSHYFLIYVQVFSVTSSFSAKPLLRTSLFTYACQSLLEITYLWWELMVILQILKYNTFLLRSEKRAVRVEWSSFETRITGWHTFRWKASWLRRLQNAVSNLCTVKCRKLETVHVNIWHTTKFQSSMNQWCRIDPPADTAMRVPVWVRGATNLHNFFLWNFRIGFLSFERHNFSPFVL